MKAFVMRETGEVGFMDKPMPKPCPGDAIVRTTKALICTSDSHTVGGGIGQRHNLTLGHEAVGVVHEVGSEVDVFHPGDRTAGARLRGAGLVIGVEAVPRRQELARSYGADEIVDFTTEDVVERITDLTGGEGVDTAIEALGADVTFQTAVKVTKPGGTISSTGYFGEGEFVHIPRVDWGVGMADKTIATGLCPGGRLRMERLLQILATGRVDPTLMTTHRFTFDQMDRAFEVSGKKLDDVIKPLITFS
jgi:threonine dehydrogenase-like Zn-dependent dehydrogenase